MQFTRVLLIAGALALATPARATGTRTFDLDTQDELSGGDLQGASVGSDGVVRAGFRLGNLRIDDASTVLAALPRADGSVLLGTSPGGKIYRVAGDQASVFADTKETGVTSLVEDARGNVYAATFPDGKIFKVSQGPGAASGKADVFATLPDTTYVWALAFDRGKTNLYAATGLPEGRVYRVNLAGQAEVTFRCEAPHIVSLAVAPNGDVLAGTSGTGYLYRISGPGRASVVYDFPGSEVKAVAAASDGSIWAISNEYTDPPDIPKRAAGALRSPAGPAQPGTHTKPGKGQLWRFDPRGRPEKMMAHSEFHYMSLALDAAGKPYVGTGAEGRVYTVDDAHAVTLVADTDERQVTALSLDKNPFIVSSDGAVFHRILGRGGADALWTSKVFDTGARSHFGELSFRASGPVELSTRTGDTDVPDDTWSAWSAGMSRASRIASPAARFVQVRARLLRGDSELREVLVPFVNENLRAVVTQVTAQPKSGAHETKEGPAASGGDVPKHDSTIHIAWKVENPDQDALRYRLFYEREGDATWREILRTDEILTRTDYDWDTATLPEGKYRVRVLASDEASNPPGQGLTHTLEASDVLVDNTAPTFQSLAIAGRRLRARVVDGLGPIARLDVSFDGRGAKDEWRPLAPVDGIFDTADETFDADLGSVVPPGSHIVAVRAFDAAGNSVVQEIPVR
ncbi:MAG TPA: hypothetical protein VGH28_27815 [Polyangiaceae bacterium]|jgi:hypothetical protein